MKLTARPALTLALVAGLSGFGGLSAAQAAPPVCNLITDPAGDATGPTQTLDVVSGDIASDKKRITAVIRMANLAETDPTSPTGLSWGLEFNAAGTDLPYFILAQRDTRGAVGYSFGSVDGNSLTVLGGGTGVIDIAKKEVRIHVKATDLRIKPGTELTNLLAQGRRFIGAPGLGLYLGTDSSDPLTSKPYVMGAPSCVKPGK